MAYKKEEKHIVYNDTEHNRNWYSDGSCELIDPSKDCTKDTSIDTEYVDGNHASYYGGENNTYECIKVIEAWREKGNWNYEDGFYLGTVMRYLCRNGNKKDNAKIQDLQKCINYLNMYVEKLKGEQ